MHYLLPLLLKDNKLELFGNLKRCCLLVFLSLFLVFLDHQLLQLVRKCLFFLFNKLKFTL
uniref:Uncharacterized protein n=1 Tax=Manihot esculenta TaxID=3983 RepID=A0A2C9U9J0_MANES